MRLVPLIVAFLTTGIWLSGCGDDEAVELKGTWVAGCHSETDAEGSVGYFVNQVTFSGTSLSFEKIQYAGSECETKKQTATITATYSTKSDLKKGETYDITMNISRLDVSVHSADLVSAFNIEGICGEGFFTSDITREVTASDCNGLFTFVAGSMLYDIFSTDGSVLTFGQPEGELDGTMAEKRHNKLASHIYTKK